MDKIAGYIYRLYNNHRDIIYIGKTVNPVQERLRNHFNFNQYNNLHDFWRKEITYFDYAAVKTESNLAVYEVYYINKSKPTYNSSQKYKDKLTIDIEKLNFCNLKQIENTNINVKEYKNKLEEKEREVKNNLSIDIIKLQKIYRSIPENYCKSLKEAMNNCLGYRCSFRNRLILKLLYYNGLKTGDIENLKVEDINFQGGYIILPERNIGQRVYLKNEILSELKEFIKQNKKFVFYSMRGKTLSSRSIRHIANKKAFLSPSEIRTKYQNQISKMVDDKLLKSYLLGITYRYNIQEEDIEIKSN